MSAQLNKPYFMLLAAIFGMTSLIGCQTHTNQATKVATHSQTAGLKNVPKQQLLERLTYYNWTLIQIKNVAGKSTPFYHQPPLIMNVAPDRLLFNEGCHHYQVFINETIQPPFQYRFSNFKTGSADNCQNDNKSEIQLALERLFNPYSDTTFKFEPLLQNQSKPMMALNIKDSAMFIFSGNKKPQLPVSGITLTHELLERYQWQLVRATDNNQNKIDTFYQPDIPIKVSFSTDQYRQHFGMSIGRHGISGTYALAPNQTLLTASDLSPAISFGKRLDTIRLKFARIALKPSQLILNQQLDIAVTSDVNRVNPRYLLTQKVETGETLVWQNAKRELR